MRRFVVSRMFKKATTAQRNCLTAQKWAGLRACGIFVVNRKPMLGFIQGTLTCCVTCEPSFLFFSFFALNIFLLPLLGFLSTQSIWRLDLVWTLLHQYFMAAKTSLSIIACAVTCFGVIRMYYSIFFSLSGLLCISLKLELLWSFQYARLASSGCCFLLTLLQLSAATCSHESHTPCTCTTLLA